MVKRMKDEIGSVLLQFIDGIVDIVQPANETIEIPHAPCGNF
jgi:hypothetical protein